MFSCRSRGLKNGRKWARFLGGRSDDGGRPVKRFLEILTNIRIATGEIGGTASLVFLVSYGIYEAWQAFIVKLLK
jgi:hypothetical protein